MGWKPVITADFNWENREKFDKRLRGKDFPSPFLLREDHIGLLGVQSDPGWTMGLSLALPYVF